ncbi:MAG: hypothetical protein M1401_03375 [Chloroflexi bacterium]|nr:hypothetical protein [Chloroflexota bacterium]MCL5107908.1 hypothetical protein [Chloroflexota bacterium]
MTRRRGPSCPSLVEASPYGEVGRLERDEDGRLLCHACGRYCHSLAQHARLAHGLEADDYREWAGLNRQTRLVSETMRERLRAATAPIIERLRAQGKLRNWGEDRQRWAEDKAEAVTAIEQGLRPEASQHRSEAFAGDPARAERRRQRNLAGLDKSTPEAISAGLRRYYAEHPEAVDRERLRGQIPAAVQASLHRPREVVCPECGQAFTAESHRERYCPACRPAVQRRYDREYKRRRRTGVPESGMG